MAFHMRKWVGQRGNLKLMQACQKIIRHEFDVRLALTDEKFITRIFNYGMVTTSEELPVYLKQIKISLSRAGYDVEQLPGV